MKLNSLVNHIIYIKSEGEELRQHAALVNARLRLLIDQE